MSNNLHNLPALDKNHNLRNLNEAGQWMSLEIDLDSLAKALPVDREAAFTDPDEPIRAIPDPWAQATAFGFALRYESHSLHAMAVSQWRGLLAILALQYQHRGDFSIVPVAVDLSDNSAFAKVMTTLTPEVAMAGEAGLWRTPSVLMLRAANDPNGMFEQPLAMTNPICLVSPGRSSGSMIVPKIDWAQGRLHCPLEAGAPPRSMAELSILHVFLTKLAEEVSRPRPDRNGALGRDPIATDIAKLLYAYIADVQRRLARDPLRSLPVENVQNTLPALFRPLFNMVPLSDDTGDHLTEAEVMTAPLPAGQGAHIKGFILADPAVAAALGRDAAQVLVWKNHSLADVLRSPAKFEEVRKAALSAGYMMLTIDDVLTERAVRFKRKALIETHPVGLQDMLLPLRPLALLVSQAEGGRSLSDVLRDRTRGQVAGDRASFTLSMRLKSAGGVNSDGSVRVDLTRHYSANPTANSAHGGGEGHLVDCEDWDIYNCQLWPNFRSKAWHTYMARFYYRAAAQSKMARPQQALSARLLHDVIAQASDSGNADIALRACNRGEALADRRYGDALPLLKSANRLTAKNNSFFEEVQYSTAPFDAIFYTDSYGDERSAKPVGMVLLSLEEKDAPKQRTKVAIDFGTTNTVGAFGTGMAEPVVFKNRLIFPLKPADQIVREQAIHASRNQYVGFLPPELRRTPIPSVAKPKHPYRHEETLWAFRNLIYFHTSQPPAPGAEERELADFLEATRDAKFNLKWSKDADVRDAAQDFLTQFIVMTAAELFDSDHDPASSKWSFSIPESMDETHRDTFLDNIYASMRAVGMDVRNLGGANGEDSRKLSDYVADLQSEGLSAANYMLTNGGFSSDRLSIILDIGGGTTDMTIWERKTPRWKGSIRLAGGQFFTELLVNNTQILSGIGLDSWAKSLNASAQEFTDERDVKKRQMAEMLFSGRSHDNAGPDLQASMRDHWGRLTSQMGDPLRHAALTYLSGIAYYNGLVVRQLIDREGGMLSAQSAHDPAFAICGRGGGLFAMLHGSRGADDRTEITRALSVFGKALQADDVQRPRFSASPAPKLEVVRGMLTGHGDIDTTAKGMAGLGSSQPLGLSLHTNGAVLAATELLSFETLSHRIDAVDLTEFQRFLTALEECAGIAIDIVGDKRENAARDIEGATITALEKMAAEIERTPSVQRKKIVLEPPFLIALRALIKIMAGPVETRNAKLTIWGED